MIYKPLHGKLNIEQYEPFKNGVDSVTLKV